MASSVFILWEPVDKNIIMANKRANMKSTIQSFPPYIILSQYKDILLIKY